MGAALAANTGAAGAMHRVGFKGLGDLPQTRHFACRVLPLCLSSDDLFVSYIWTKIWLSIEGVNMQNIFADVAVSVSELKKNPSAVMTGAAGMPVAVLNHNRVMGYMVPAELYEAMMERLEDLELSELAKSRLGEKGVPVSLDDL